MESLDDLPLFAPDADWEEVQAEHGNCLHRACKHYEACHYQRSRRRMDGVQILIVNHALYMADVALRMAGASYLPEHRAVVFDEAHHLERGHIPAAMYRRHAARSTIDDRHHQIARGMAAMGKRRLRTAQQLDEVATWEEISAAARARCVTIRPVLAWSITPTGRERLGFWRDMGRI